MIGEGATHLGEAADLATDAIGTIAHTGAAAGPVGEMIGSAADAMTGGAQAIGEAAAHTASEGLGGLGDTIGNAIGDALGGNIGNSIGDAIGHSIGDAVAQAIGDQLGTIVESIGDAIGDAVSHALGDAFGISSDASQTASPTPTEPTAEPASAAAQPSGLFGVPAESPTSGEGNSSQPGVVVDPVHPTGDHVSAGSVAGAEASPNEAGIIIVSGHDAGGSFWDQAASHASSSFEMGGDAPASAGFGSFHIDVAISPGNFDQGSHMGSHMADNFSDMGQQDMGQHDGGFMPTDHAATSGPMHADMGAAAQPHFDIAAAPADMGHQMHI
jgi:hypothetical protein